MRKFLSKILVLSFIITLNSCGGFKSVDIKDRGTPEERRRQAVEEGRGIGVGSVLGGRKSTTYEFSTSNPMWRASLETLDFLPLTTVDYSGGVIITDWYSDDGLDNRDAIKISIRFLGNEIRSESLKIIVHKKICSTVQNCKVTSMTNSQIREKLHSTILRKAALLNKDTKNKKKKN